MTQRSIEKNSRIFLAGQRSKQFDAIQRCLVPRSQNFTAEQREKSHELVNHILSDKPGLIHLKIAVFLYVIDAVSLLFGAHFFRRLNPKKQTQVMNWFFDSSFPLFRKGFWGINTLAKMGVYGQTSFYPEIGYQLKDVQR